MPKNLLFLTDKLPKPNYDKKYKESKKATDEENKNYRSFNKIGTTLNNNLNSINELSKENNVIPIRSKRPAKLNPLNNNSKINNISLNNVIIENEKENTKNRSNI